MEEINKIKSQFFEKINKIDKTLYRCINFIREDLVKSKMKRSYNLYHRNAKYPKRLLQTIITIKMDNLEQEDMILMMILMMSIIIRKLNS